TSGKKDNGLSLSIGGKNVAIPLRQFGQIKAGDASKINEIEKFKVTIVRGDRRFGERKTITSAKATPFVAAGSSTFRKPIDNIGNKTLPDYAAYAAQHVYDINIPGC